MFEETWALIVEDDAHSLVTLSSILRDLGIRFKRNTTGADVLEQVRNMNPRPQFILLNIDLTQGNAFNIQKRIRTDPTASRIPVVALASADNYAVRNRVKRAGFAGMIVKPLPRRVFGEMVNRVLSGEQVWEAIH